MNKVGKFEKVSFEQFKKDINDEFNGKFTDDEISSIYDNIKLPKRGTIDSAGYDLFSPIDFELEQNEVTKIPTGIRVKIDDGWFLGCLPRSGLGFKFYESLVNTMGIIDSGYYDSDNEGHIMAKIINRNPSDSAPMMRIKAGQGFIQGIFFPFGITYDDSAEGIRNGGFGSTDKK